MFFSFSDRGAELHDPFKISNSDRYFKASPFEVFAHELHHVWDRFSDVNAINIGKPVAKLPERETFAVRYTNRIRREHKIPYQRTSYKSKSGVEYDIPLY